LANRDVGTGLDDLPVGAECSRSKLSSISTRKHNNNE
jgi:hypothetical protein